MQEILRGSSIAALDGTTDHERPARSEFRSNSYEIVFGGFRGNVDLRDSPETRSIEPS